MRTDAASILLVQYLPHASQLHYTLIILPAIERVGVGRLVLVVIMMCLWLGPWSLEEIESVRGLESLHRFHAALAAEAPGGYRPSFLDSDKRRQKKLSERGRRWELQSREGGSQPHRLAVD